MLKVDQFRDIQQLYRVENESIREISRKTGISRNTVRRYIREPKTPRYIRTQPYQKPALGGFAERIDSILTADLDAPRKQRHTAKRIFERLRDEGYTGGESTLRAYVADRKRELHVSVRGVTFPLEHKPEEAAAQVDWGERKVVIDGMETTVHLCVVRLNCSGLLFVQAYPLERQEMFFAGHLAAFEFFGGTPPKITYDNLSTAVKKIFKGRNREEQTAFTVFRAHYLYKSDFCNVAAPNEKGGVECMVGYVSRNFFTPVPQYDSFDALNRALFAWCERNALRTAANRTESIATLFRLEAPHLLPPPKYAYECCRTYQVRADHQALAAFECNRYSIPVSHANRKLTLKAFPFEVHICDAHSVIARHRRVFGRYEYVLDPIHYLPLLERKPGALFVAKPFQNWNLPPVFEAFRQSLLERDPQRGGKDYVRILMMLGNHTVEALAAALESAAAYRCFHGDAVRCLLTQRHEEPGGDAADLSRFPALTAVRVAAPDTQKYNTLI
jgi:transposase